MHLDHKTSLHIAPHWITPIPLFHSSWEEEEEMTTTSILRHTTYLGSNNIRCSHIFPFASFIECFTSSWCRCCSCHIDYDLLVFTFWKWNRLLESMRWYSVFKSSSINLFFFSCLLFVVAGEEDFQKNEREDGGPPIASVQQPPVGNIYGVNYRGINRSMD